MRILAENINRYTSVFDRSLNGIEDLPLGGQVQRLLDQGEGSVVATDSLDGGAEVQKALVLNGRSDLSTHAHSFRCLVCDYASSCFLH